MITSVGTHYNLKRNGTSRPQAASHNLSAGDGIDQPITSERYSRRRRASGLSSDLLNRGSVHSRLGHDDEAMADYEIAVNAGQAFPLETALLLP